MPHRRFLALIVMTGVSGLYGLDARADEPPSYEVYAVRYGTCPGCPVSFLVQGAEPQRKVDLAMTFWVLKGPERRTVLVDAGFYRKQFFEDFKGIADYIRPDRAVERLGIKPEEVTDVIVTHMHSDHARWCRPVSEGDDLDPERGVQSLHRARQAAARQRRATRAGLCPGPGEAQHRGPGSSGRRRRQGDPPGSDRLHRGKHTFASQYVGVNTKAGRMVIASDNVYLYENLDKHLPITADARRQVEPGGAGPDEADCDQPSADHPGTRPGGVRPVPEARERCGSTRVGPKCATTDRGQKRRRSALSKCSPRGSEPSTFELGSQNRLTLLATEMLDRTQQFVDGPIHFLLMIVITGQATSVQRMNCAFWHNGTTFDRE